MKEDLVVALTGVGLIVLGMLVAMGLTLWSYILCDSPDCLVQDMFGFLTGQVDIFGRPTQ